MTDAWQVLGLTKDATRTQVREVYHALARRWHPDRFQEGPERMWAERRMMEINAAYREIMKGFRQLETTASEGFCDVRRLVELGQLAAARQALARIALRDAEWNYLFGDVLLKMGEYKKAALYLSVAAHQCPENRDYRRAYDSARGRCAQKRVQDLWRSMSSAVTQGARRVMGKN